MSMIFSSDDTDFAQYYADTEPAVKVHSATTWTEQLEALADIPARLTGAKLPWKSTHDYIRFRPGEVTLWAGINGSGKSQLVGNVVLGFCAQQETSCIASFEMAPLSTLGRMQRQAAMCSTPAREFTKRFMGLLENRLWIYDQQGTVDPRMLYAVIRYCGRKLGVKHMVVDNLAKCVRGADDYTGEKVFIDVMTALARDEGMHIHVVHHIKKGENEDKPPTKWDVKGSGAIVDQVDQLLIVWRNKLKERAIQKLAAQGEPVDDETYSKPDVLLCCEKNRHGEWEGRIPLWYHKDSLQYTGDPRCKPLNFLGSLA
ncbi:DnaB-like helicase C-terminal domain-containing protein [Bordetella bronchiseptica]|uniref:SF4 helicase domain-containing protein n=1 Tax=Bordetella bronchiseptica 253 TaxID=568707 RepID=A0A0H3P0C1_BORBO|nr:DnaB-like helicase C-terminal domain-containing protein [Bordetella bronchiseptica]KCV26208.1 AAA domain protein [Bordetella bronchiseptica 00-P-2730]SHT43555.1 Replicative DNA helicase [Mycobacteroides abscessus subsp. abscessus]KDD30901.1 AAA domain protein [Bordetella bronchiseptica MBORD849]KDD39424.1 AAA domain protein [Bordetella bronchiseptica MBORD839]WLS60420.1 DnaB-like helicase C-terminal domain-containing protein [Bordetella bronchiseptica]